jgi:phage minor structural protein
MITIHAADATDFSSLGLGTLEPLSYEIEEIAGGKYELTMEHPMDKAGKWWLLAEYRIIKAPAPARETPLVSIGAGSGAQTVTRSIYRVHVNTRLRLRTAPSTSSGKIIGRYKNGTEVVKIGEDGNWFEVIVSEGGATGWMYSSYLTHVRDEQETIEGDTPGEVIQPRQTREQLFRIVTVERDDASATVKVTAEHIFYDLTGNIIPDEYAPEDVEAADVCGELMTKALNETGFRLICGAEGKVTADYTGKSIVSALLEKEIGIVPITKGRLIRDNYDIFILPDEHRDRGVTIRHGKNLNGAVLTTDTTTVVTRVVPVGKDADGEPLYLDGTIYVDSPRAAEIPVARAKRIEYDVSVAKKAADADEEKGIYASEADARAELQRLAEAEFETGIDAPTVRLDVDFTPLENTEEYAAYADLQAIHMYDTVHVYATRTGISAALRMTGYTWDGMANEGRGRYKKITLGVIEELDVPVYGYDIADGTFSGTKIIKGTMDGSKIRSLSIGYAQISVAAIEQLIAQNLTAVSAYIEDLAAGRITTDELYAAIATIAEAQITTANINRANIDWAQIQTLAANVADIVLANITEAKIDAAQIEWADITTLNAAVADIITASIDTAFIRQANINWAAIDTLVSQIATTAKAQIGTANIIEANIDWASISTLAATIADIAQAKIDNITVTTAQITDLRAQIANVITLAATDGSFNFASIRDLVASAMILEQGVAGTVTIKNLVATEANFVSATMGKLVLQGDDGLYYEVAVQSDGTIYTNEIEVTPGEAADGEMADGRPIVATQANVADLNAENIRAQSAIISRIFTAALDAQQITASEAFIASATVPELWATSIRAIGAVLDLSANDTVRSTVGQMISNIAPGSRNYIRNSLTLSEIIVTARHGADITITDERGIYWPHIIYCGEIAAGGERL